MLNTAINNIKRRFEIELNGLKEIQGDIVSYGALGYLIDDKIYLIAPSRSKFTTKMPKGKEIGELVELNGNFQSQDYTIVKKLNTPAFVIAEGEVFFNATPFTNFQKWLQFEYNIIPYLNWYDRMFWLDEYASNLLKNIAKYAPENILYFEDKDEKEIIVTFRHDVDCSRDLSFLEVAITNNIPACYSILLDKNRKFWLNKLKQYPNIEISYHYESNYVSMLDYIKIVFNKFLKTYFKMENLPNNWKKRSLKKQLTNAISMGIDTKIIHRHFGFIKYPEIINEFEEVSNCGLSMGGSFGPANVLKNNLKCANGSGSGYYHYEGDVGSPFWYPFKLYNPISQKEVDFWEQNFIQEPSSEFMEKLFQKRIYGINKSIFVVSLHPAHATTKTFREDGQIETFKEIIKMKDKYNIIFKNFITIFDEVKNA